MWIMGTMPHRKRVDFQRGTIESIAKRCLSALDRNEADLLYFRAASLNLLFSGQRPKVHALRVGGHKQAPVGRKSHPPRGARPRFERRHRVAGRNIPDLYRRLARRRQQFAVRRERCVRAEVCWSSIIMRLVSGS